MPPKRYPSNSINSRHSTLFGGGDAFPRSRKEIRPGKCIWKWNRRPSWRRSESGSCCFKVGDLTPIRMWMAMWLYICYIWFYIYMKSLCSCNPPPGHHSPAAAPLLSSLCMGSPPVRPVFCIISFFFPGVVTLIRTMHHAWLLQGIARG